MTETDQKSAALTALFTAYPPAQAENLEGLSAVYHMAIEDVPGWAVQRAVKAFIKAGVEGHNSTFRPRTGQLAQEARRQIALETERQSGHILAEQRRLRADGKTDWWRHRKGELAHITAHLTPDAMPALPDDSFTALIEHRTDCTDPASLAEVIPLKARKAAV